jgi:hypothetical protein
MGENDEQRRRDAHHIGADGHGLEAERVIVGDGDREHRHDGNDDKSDPLRFRHAAARDHLAL